MLDIRIPIGLMFVIFGAILFIFGLFFSDPKIYLMHSLGLNINLAWGGVMLVLGAALLFLARRRRPN